MTSDKSSEERLSKFLLSITGDEYYSNRPFELAELAWVEQEGYWRERVKELELRVTCLQNALKDIGGSYLCVLMERHNAYVINPLEDDETSIERDVCKQNNEHKIEVVENTLKNLCPLEGLKSTV